MSLSIAVNLLWCVPGEVGGSEEYLVRQLRGLDAIAAAPDRVEPTLFALESFAAAHPDLTGLFPMQTPRTSGRRRPVRVAYEHTWLRWVTRGADVVHHGGGTAPVGSSHPYVLTIHDLQWLTLPEYVSRTKLRYLRAIVPRSIRHAAVVTVPSAYVQQTVVDAYGVAPERVVVVPHGIPAPADPQVDERALRDRYALGSGPLLVYPAITHPHKNHVLLVDLMRRAWTDPDLRLVLLGGRGAADEEVEQAIDTASVRDRVLRPGRVPDADRDALVSIAEALVFPSRYEGFGAPLIEAMALGTPVVCGDHPAVREVVGDAALVLPYDPDAWTGALEHVRAHRAAMAAAGRRRAATFTDAASATALASAYEMAVL